MSEGPKVEHLVSVRQASWLLGPVGSSNGTVTETWNHRISFHRAKVFQDVRNTDFVGCLDSPPHHVDHFESKEMEAM